MIDRGFFLLGSLLGFTAVAAGAFGGHMLKPKLAPEQYALFEIAARYQMYHALALLAVAWACSRWLNPWSAAAGWLLFAGNLIFSGSLYLLSLTGISWLGAITPVGGLCLITGWLCLAMAAWRGERAD